MGLLSDTTQTLDIVRVAGIERQQEEGGAVCFVRWRQYFTERSVFVSCIFNLFLSFTFVASRCSSITVLGIFELSSIVISTNIQVPISFFSFCAVVLLRTSTAISNSEKRKRRANLTATSKMTNKVFLLSLLTGSVYGFVPQQPRSPSYRTSERYSSFQEEEDSVLQWNLFKKHHAKGSWKGIWSTHDNIGDVVDETVASVDLNLQGDTLIDHTHTIVVGAKRSDCETCFDSMETKTLPVAQYTPDNLRNARFAACGMVNGPTLLRSGAMATELVLSHGDGRVRVIFQHAPVWEKGVEPGSCPPQGLKLFRAMVSREALRPSAPTFESEAKNPPTEGNPKFFRPVPPFNWFKKWSGTSWTWGAQAGNRGWNIEEMEETDSWQGITPVECWNLKLPGGLFVQAPHVVTDLSTALCRLAWLPDDETLLRVEAGVSALQPMMVEEDDTMVGFKPPSLTSLRCDMMVKMGELENASRPSRDWDENLRKMGLDTSPGSVEKETPKGSKTEDSPLKPEVAHKSSSEGDEPESGLEAIRDALSL